MCDGTIERSQLNERDELDLAQLDAAATVDSARMSALQLNSIQAGRVAFVRWPLRYVRPPPGSLYVLLAAVLLVFNARRRMNIPQRASGPRSDEARKTEMKVVSRAFFLSCLNCAEFSFHKY